MIKNQIIPQCFWDETVLCGERLITFWGNIVPSSPGLCKPRRESSILYGRTRRSKMATMKTM